MTQAAAMTQPSAPDQPASKCLRHSQELVTVSECCTPGLGKQQARSPQEDKARRVCDSVNVQGYDLLPCPSGCVANTWGSARILLPRRVNQNNIKLCPKGGWR